TRATASSRNYDRYNLKGPKSIAAGVSGVRQPGALGRCYLERGDENIPPMILSHPNDHDNRSFSSSSALAASARARAWERLAGPESTPEPRWRTYSSPDF